MDDDDDNNNNADDDEARRTQHSGTGGGDEEACHHRLPLHSLHPRESYVVSDVLGQTVGPADVEHVPAPTRPAYARAATLHNRAASDGGGPGGSFASLLRGSTSGPQLLSASGGSGSALAQSAMASPGHAKTGRKKAVGFAPPVVASSHRHGTASTTTSVPKQPVHLNSTDGLVVVSIFLPVILRRSDAGVWSADWDYEVLLSMQTHLRVTRVGVVKWRGGWHQPLPNHQSSPTNHPHNAGHNTNGESAHAESGVPRHERHLVEECLRPFNCVPVWIDPILFGHMYNGFCKGVLWPVVHNVTSVYCHKSEEDDDVIMGRADGNATSAGAGGDGGGSSSSNTTTPTPTNAQFSEYSMDDIEQGPIHGGRGREAELWGAYNTVNRLFAERVVQCFHEGDLVWIHGFHLLILPSYLTRRIPMAKVGIFLHTPFPSSEIFRTVWCREDLLRGMLNADQVGFHLFEYARHFLTSCRRLLGLNYGMIPDTSGGHTLAIDTNGRSVVVTSIHAGVEPPVLNQILSHVTTIDKANNIRLSYPGKTIFCGIDRLESLKGIPLKLLGLERFLRRRPEWIGKLVVVQIGISAFERGEDYFRTKAETNKLVTKINGLWPGTVQFQECAESEMGLQQRMALLRAADVVVVTSIRDGLNLLPLEFTIAHQDALTGPGRLDGRKRGLCILSEFASCTRVMRGALHVNPWKIAEIATAYDQALHMSEEERLRRISIASEFVTRVTTQRWALAVMLDLKGVHKNLNPATYSGAGLGLNYRLLGMDTGFKSLDTNVVAKAYKRSKGRLILVDYGGTIVNNDNVSCDQIELRTSNVRLPWLYLIFHFSSTQLNNLTRFQMVKERTAPSTPTPQVIEALQGLCDDKRNTVFVVSGKERHSLTKTLGGIKNLGLAAEHGMFLSWPTNKTNSKRRWETLVPETDRTWRSLAVTIMEVYTSRTHGSYIEETEMKVLWQYRDADTEFGSLQAKELEDHLSKLLHSFPVDILHGGIKEGGYVEVRPKGVNKGVLAMRVLKRFPDIAQKDSVDFALVIGDDHCDEPMLSIMRQIGRRVVDARRAQNGEDPLPDLPATIQLVDVSSCDPFVSPDLEVFTCTVGKKPSAAATYLHDVEEAQELLESLVKVSTRERNFTSAVDLVNYQGYNPSPLSFHGSESLPVPNNGFGGGLLQRAMSVDRVHQESQQPRAPRSFNEYCNGLGTMEEDDEDDAPTF